MAAHLNDIIDAPLYTEVAHVVAGCGITGEVDAFDGVPVALIAFCVAVDGAHLRGPGLPHDQESALVRSDRLAVFVNHIGFDSWEWACGAARFERQDYGGRDERHARLGLPPCIDNRQLVAPNVFS